MKSNIVELCKRACTKGEKRMLLNEKEYMIVLQEALEHIKTAKYQAAISVNMALLHRNWHLGKLIMDNSQWGNKFIDNLARDIKLEFPESTGYSIRNLKYMKKFNSLFAEDEIWELSAAYSFISGIWVYFSRHEITAQSNHLP